MCIRDRVLEDRQNVRFLQNQHFLVVDLDFRAAILGVEDDVCLLYTSDAADERSSVDLGGRRIIKKKNK